LLRLFDSHFHIIDPDFPLIRNQGFLPDPYNTDAYTAETQTYSLAGGAIVSGSFQGFDQGYLVRALQQLGAGFVGVTQLPLDVSDEEILKLDQCGVAAVRFNLKRGCVDDLSQIDYFARRVHALAGWHSEFYVDANSLPEVRGLIAALPCAVVDHLGLEHANKRIIAGLCDKGVYVKAPGFGRIDFDPFPLMQTLHAINPASLVFGTDLPSTRAKRPYAHQDYLNVLAHFDRSDAERILYQNAIELYRVGSEGALACP